MPHASAQSRPSVEADTEHLDVLVVGAGLSGIGAACHLRRDHPNRSLAVLEAREVIAALRALSVRPLGRMLLRRPTRSATRRLERTVFHDPAFATPARVERSLELAGRKDGAAVMVETANSLGNLRGVRPEWRRRLLPAVAASHLPTLVVWGDRDAVLPATHLEAAREALPQARTRLFPATGHMPQIERAKDFAELVLDFWS